MSQKNSTQQETCNEHSFSLSTLLFSRVVQEIAVSMNGDNILALQFKFSSRFEFQAGHPNACYQNDQKSHRRLQNYDFLRHFLYRRLIKSFKKKFVQDKDSVAYF